MAPKPIKMAETGINSSEKDVGPGLVRAFSDHFETHKALDMTSRSSGIVSGACWPDPDPLYGTGPRADDVTRMNTTPVRRIFQVRNEIDVVNVLAMARAEGVRVSMRGTQHSMGGQSIAPGGYVLDMKKLSHMSYNSHSGLVACGTGCTWADLIRYLNQFGMSPRTMQSYSSFSVGGTIAVNGHGITTDECLVESVRSFRLVKWDGSFVTCSREAAEGTESRELFGLAIGGYGLFGVITEVTMLTNPNVHLAMEKVSLSIEEFDACYAGVQAADVSMKLARLNILDTSGIDLFIFRCAHAAEARTVSILGRQPKGLSWQKQLMYKWLMPNAQELRYKFEQMSGTRVDWSGALERNTMMYISAEPVAKLYEPLWRVDDTFVLQEFFVPRGSIQAWLISTRPIYEELASHRQLRLLNTTIRFVNHDSDTILNYSSCTDGMFAFVLYYRLPRTEEADSELHRFHSQFVKATLELNGTFYLPYRHHYTMEEMTRAYPQADRFFKLKEKHDPCGLFDSLWFRKYGLPFCGDDYQARIAKIPHATARPSRPPHSIIVPERHQQAFRKLMSNPHLRHEFVEGFLTQIFNVMDNHQLYEMMAKAVWNPANDSDIKIYRSLQQQLQKLNSPLHEAMKAAKGLRQMAAQKKELTRETVSIVSRFGMMGRLQDYVSVGDHGKMVLPLREALGMKGKVWVVHSEESQDLLAMAERCSLEPVGTHVPWILAEGGRFQGVPDECADLVTINQGLHHMRQSDIEEFLAEVLRVLRPSGLFIVREHDASEELMPMLELAHSVFNAVKGVSDCNEEAERRAFRSVEDWRSIVVSAGFEDSWLYEMERGDPTMDEMLCFYKPPLQVQHVEAWMDPASSSPDTGAEDMAPSAPQQLNQFMALLDAAPHALLAVVQDVLGRLAEFIPQARSFISEISSQFPTGQTAMAKQLIDQVTEPLEQFLQRMIPLLDNLELQDGTYTLGDIIPREAFLIAAALIRKKEAGTASTNELFLAGILQDAQSVMNSISGNDTQEKNHDEDSSDEAAFDTSATSTSSVAANDVEAVLNKLFATFPEIQDPDYVDRMGFDRRARSGIKARVNTPVDKIAAALANVLDQQSWPELKAALLQGVQEGKPPTAELIFGRRGENPWSRAMMALLSSPAVRLTTGTSMALKFVGLGEVVEMWHVSQANVMKSTPKGQPEQRHIWQEEDVLNNIKNGMKRLKSKPKTVEMDKETAHNIDNVAEVISAQYGYQSLTADYVDVTDKVRSRLQNGVLQLEGVHLRTWLGSGDQMVKGLDSMRKNLLGKRRQLIIEYRSSQDPGPEKLVPKVNALLDFLTACGATRQHHVDDGHYTWFKLTEWMQVEILQIYGSFLETSVWYRFPYTQFLRVYFETLYNVVKVVATKHGQTKALASSGFALSFVPGIMMSMLMAQLQLAALPLQALPSESGFGAVRDESKLYEQLVVQLPQEAPEPCWQQLDSRLSGMRVVPGLYIVRAPAQKALTAALLALATIPSARVLEISNQRHIQVRVLLNYKQNQFPKIQKIQGCEVMFEFEYPTSGTQQPPGTSLSLCVTVPYLLATIRSCNQAGIEVQQIYDFWCG